MPHDEQGEPTTMPHDECEPTTMPHNEGEPTMMPHDEGELTMMNDNDGEPTRMRHDEGEPTTMLHDECEPTTMPHDVGEPTTMPHKEVKLTTMPHDEGEPTTMRHDEVEPTTMPHDECGLTTIRDGNVFGVSPPDETQGYAGGPAQNLLHSNTAVNGEVFVAAQDAASTACVLDYSQPSNNVKNDQPQPSTLSFIGTFGSADENNVSSSLSVVAGLDIEKDSYAATSRQYFKKRSRKLCRKLQRSQTGDRKRSSFDYEQYRHQRTNPDESTPPVASSLPNRGHSPTKAEVKKMNQHLIDKNLRLKKDFHKADHLLKTLLADKKDLLRRLRLESKTTNKLIQSIQDEAQDTMECARDILSTANRSKKDEIQRARHILSEANQRKNETELLKDDIDNSRNELLGVGMDLRKQSARLKKQVARMTETHNRRKRALAQEVAKMKEMHNIQKNAFSEQQQQIEHDVNTEKQQWKMTIRLAEKKMLSSLKQLQKEWMMWQVLSQEAELRCDNAQLEIHRQKSNGRTLVQMQVDKTIRKEGQLKTYMLDLQEMHRVQLLRERKAKRVAIQSSKHW
jgi:hypothetical protein